MCTGTGTFSVAGDNDSYSVVNIKVKYNDRHGAVQLFFCVTIKRNV